jgi:hypothetical protein
MKDFAIRFRGQELHAAWAAFLSRVPWQDFATLTFDPKRRFPAGRELTDRETARWCHDLGWVSRRPVGWAYALERRPSGMWHAHALVVGLPASLWRFASQSWELRNGLIHVQEIDRTPHRVCLYVSKEAAMENEVVVSDTMVRYAGRLSPVPRVALYPSESTETERPTGETMS